MSAMCRGARPCAARRPDLAERNLPRLDRRRHPAGRGPDGHGPSGVGKSTLLAFVAGFLGPAFRAEGRIVLNGRDVTALPPQERRIGLLFQDALLLPHLSVRGNLLIGLAR